MAIVSTDKASLKVKELTEYLESLHISYGLGSKFDPLSAMPPEQSSVDCSGFLRYVWYHLSDFRNGEPTIIPDGSENQDAYFGSANVQYTWDTIDRSKLIVGFLPPENTSDGIGHAFLILPDDFTCESYGGHGVGRRIPEALRFMHSCVFYTPLSSH